MTGLVAAVCAAGCVLVALDAQVPRLRFARPHRSSRNQIDVRAYLDAVVAYVDSGLSISESLHGAADELGEYGSPLHSAGPTDLEALCDALRSIANAHNQHDLIRLADVVRASARTGTPMGHAVGLLSDSAQFRQDVKAAVSQELASTRASIRLLAALPLVGAVLAALLGSGAFMWLVSTPPGRLCLIAGLALEALGAFWIHRLVAAVTP